VSVAGLRAENDTTTVYPFWLIAIKCTPHKKRYKIGRGGHEKEVRSSCQEVNMSHCIFHGLRKTCNTLMKKRVFHR
jgi:hypothetical protein